MLIGARDPETMTSEQRRVYDAIASGPRKGVPLPFLAMLDSPQLVNAIQAVGATLRFSGVISDELREVAILATAAAVGSGYEWDYHARIARNLGLSQTAIDATIAPQNASALDEPVRLTIALCRAAVLERRIPQDLLQDLVTHLGRSVATEIVAIAGYYPMLALYLSAGGLDHPLPNATPR
jgi:4-carboxymuconolactone decarboxylase